MKKLLLVVFLMFSFFLLSGCNSSETDDVIFEFNNNSNFEYQLLTEVTDDIKSGFSIAYGFGMYRLVDQSIENATIEDLAAYIIIHPTTFYTVTAYPDCSDGGDFITYIETTDPDIDLFGISVGDASTQTMVKEQMDANGYIQDESDESLYKNDILRIYVQIEDGTIIKLIVNVKVTNEEGIIYWNMQVNK